MDIIMGLYTLVENVVKILSNKKGREEVEMLSHFPLCCVLLTAEVEKFQ